MCKQEQYIEGSLFWDFCCNNTNSANHYCPLLQKKCTKIKNKQSLMASFCCMILLIPIVTHRMQDQLNVMQWKVLIHHAYSQEFAICEIPLRFPHLWIITGSPHRPYTHICWPCTGGCRTVVQAAHQRILCSQDLPNCALERL